MGAVALLESSGWLLALDGRAHASHAASTLEVTWIVGRRLSPGPLELDLLLGAAAELVRDVAADGDEPRPDDAPWMYVASRLHLVPRSALGPFIGGEALGAVDDLGGSGAQAWMAGVVAGVAVRTR